MSKKKKRKPSPVTAKETHAKSGITPKLNIWIVFLILFFITILLYSGFILTNNILFESDVLNNLDTRVMLLSQLKKFVFPLWNPERLSGMPTVDAMFGDIFYPLNLLLFVLPIHKALGYKVIIHVFLAGLFFFLYLYKGFKYKINISLLGALLYMLNSQFISHTYPGHEGKMFVISLLPLVLWMLERLIEKATLWRSSLLGISVGLCLLTSHIQMTYFMLWGVFAYAMFRILFIIKDEKNWRKASGIFGFFWLGIFIGLGIGMIQLLPPYMYVRDGFSVRGPEKGMEYAASWSLHAEETASLVVPEFGNSLGSYWGKNFFKLNSEYVGLAANLLFVFSLIIMFDKINIFWLGVSAFSLLYSLGAHSPVWNICYYLIPGVKSFRGPSMIMFWFSFSLIFVGIRGLNKFINESQEWPAGKKQIIWKRLLIAIGIIAGLTIILSVAKDAVLSAWQSMFYNNIPQNKAEIMTANYPGFVKSLWIFCVLTCGLLFTFGTYMSGHMKKTTLIAILIGIAIADLWRVDSMFIKTAAPSQYLTPDRAIREVQNDPEYKRVFDLPGAYSSNFVGIFGLESVVGFHDNELKWYRNFRGERSANLFYGITGGDISKNPFLNLLNVKYLLYRAQKNRPVQVLVNHNYMPRAFLADKYEILPESLVVSRLKDTAFDYRSTVLLEKKPDGVNLSRDTSSIGIAKYSRLSPNSFRVQVNAAKKCLLVVSEVFYPGWIAKADTKPVKIYKAYGTLMAVPVPKGSHTISFTIHSKYLNIGFLITILSLLFVITAGIIEFKRKKHMTP